MRRSKRPLVRGLCRPLKAVELKARAGLGPGGGTERQVGGCRLGEGWSMEFEASSKRESESSRLF